MLFKKLTIVFLLFSFNGFFAAQSARKPQKPQIQIKTIPNANEQLNSVISNFHIKDEAASAEKQSAVILQSAKILYDSAQQQILDALLEIDNRIAYWQQQKDHPWNYFISKNPLKWVTGVAQEDEIENNLEALKNHQGELYVLLGQLSELGSAFIAGYKDIFMKDYQQGYAWVDKLLDALARIKTSQQATSNSPFIARVRLLQAKLEKVHQFKDELLSDITETAKPSYVARNWLKGGMALLAMGYGYNKWSLEQLQAPFISLGQQIQGNVVEPVKEIITDVFLGGDQGSQSNLLVPQKNLDVIYDSVKKFLNSLSTTEGYLTKADITEERKQAILAEIEKGGNSLLQELSSELSSSLLKKPKAYEAKELLAELIFLQAGSRIQRTMTGIGKIAFITPALLFGWFTYAGYQKLTEKNYAPLRHALVDINSLFVDSTKPLNDEQYGKMIYLIYELEKRAEKELPIKNNLRTNFIQDLERLKSSEFNVAAKRAIVDDMFKKYEFLGLIQKK